LYDSRVKLVATTRPPIELLCSGLLEPRLARGEILKVLLSRDRLGIRLQLDEKPPEGDAVLVQISLPPHR
jgi:hypothetical protein